MIVREARRVPVEIRRDAAQRLSNGRMLYDALFSRTGIQTYGDSVEWRPADEVFAERSRASGALAPGVLLHPDDNLGTAFGSNTYPVRGCTGEEILIHADGRHTCGKLMVWDDEWNALIAANEVAELSVGYTITPDHTPGVAPDGTRYDVVHRNIVWDHVAGVPRGNAGTARVVTDRAGIDPASRKLLADIAAQRRDAAPLYFDLGSWPERHRPAEPPPVEPEQQSLPLSIRDQERPTMDEKLAALVAALGDPAALTLPKIAEVLAEMLGTGDPAIEAMLSMIAAAKMPEPEGEGGAEEESDASAYGGGGMRPEMDAAKIEAEITARVDARVAELTDDRADAVELARLVFGRDYSTKRTDGAVKSTADIRREVVAKRDAAAIKRVDAAKTEAKEHVLAAEFARIRDAVNAEQQNTGDRLVETINKTLANRGDGAAEPDQIDELAKRLDAAKQSARSQVFGARPRPA